MISDRFEDFTQSLRMFIEQKFRFQELFLNDADEAIGNIELACKSMLDTIFQLQVFILKQRKNIKKA